MVCEYENHSVAVEYISKCVMQMTLILFSERNKEDIDLPLYDLSTLASATNHFSDTSIIATGGFGPVYKVMYVLFLI